MGRPSRGRDGFREINVGRARAIEEGTRGRGLFTFGVVMGGVWRGKVAGGIFPGGGMAVEVDRDDGDYPSRG
ncbi:MAG: hypothetical protein LBD64_03295 [Odoribacteraceae bacterium]|nr:hypothetical protein [Odoribacteraceae bacterium]